MQKVIKQCANMVIRKNFSKILVDEFVAPSYSDISSFIEEIWNFDFDEIKAESDLKSEKPEWSEFQLKGEIKRLKKAAYKNQLRIICQEVVKTIEQTVDNIQDGVKDLKKKYVD